jgi:outer membrane lipoprotein carrier protein
MWRVLLLGVLAAQTPAAKAVAPPAAAPAAAVAVKPGTSDEVVQKLQKRYDGTTDMQADVVQEMEIASFGRKLTSKGKVYFKRPGRMRWDMSDGQRQTIVADGTYLWLYQPSEQQVYKAPFGQAFQSTTPVSFLTGIGRISDDFSVTPDGEEGPLLFLRLVPRAGEGIGVLRLGVDRKTYDILSAEVRDPMGNLTRLQFSDLKRDKGVDDALFVFQVPQGAEVVEAPTGME